MTKTEGVLVILPDSDLEFVSDFVLRISPAGAVGADFDGARIRQGLTARGTDPEGVINDADRPSTVKERYIGRAAHRHPQQLLRVDFETRQPVQNGVEAALAEAVRHQ